MTHVYRRTNSVLVGIVLHGFYTGSIGAFGPDLTDPKYVTWTAVMAILLCAFVAIVVTHMRRGR